MKKYVLIYGVECSKVSIVETDLYGAWITYKVRYGRKTQKAWIDYAMIGNSPVLSDLYREYTRPCDCKSCREIRSKEMTRRFYTV